MSGASLKPPDPETLAGLDGVERSVWRSEEAWRGMGGKTDYDGIVALLKEGRKHGRLLSGGVEVSMSIRALALAAAISKRSAGKAIARLKESGWLSRGLEASSTNAGTFVLVRHARVSHSNHGGDIEPAIIYLMQHPPSGLRERGRGIRARASSLA